MEGRVGSALGRVGTDLWTSQNMMKQAQEMQERLQQEMSQLSVQATAGGGMVTVTVNGHKHLQRIAIDPEVVSKDDVGMLQDLIVAAVNDAHRKVDDAMKQRMGGMLAAWACRTLIGRGEPQIGCTLCSPIPAGTRRSVQAAARRRRQERAAAGLPRPAHAARGHRAAVPGDSRRQGPRHLLHHLQQHHRHRPLPDVRRRGRDHRVHLRRRGAAERERGGAHRRASTACFTC